MQATPIFSTARLYVQQSNDTQSALGTYVGQKKCGIYVPRVAYNRFLSLIKATNCNPYDGQLYECLFRATKQCTLVYQVLPLISHYTDNTLQIPIKKNINKAVDVCFSVIKEYTWLDKQDGRNIFQLEYLSCAKHIGYMIVDVIKHLSTLQSFSEMSILDQINCAFHCLMKGQEFYTSVKEDPRFAEYLYMDQKQYSNYFEDVYDTISYIIQTGISATVVQQHIDIIINQSKQAEHV